MYNLSLPRLSANYYGLPTTVQLQAVHELMFTVRCLATNCPRYCTVPALNGILWDRSPISRQDVRKKIVIKS